MSKRFYAACAAVAIAAAAPPAGNAGPSAEAFHCRKAIIGGAHQCIYRGQFCSRRFERDYRRYGYSCSRRDPSGRMRLR